MPPQPTLSRAQWVYILLNMLGLRSGAAAGDIGSAASYAMDDGMDGARLPPIPPQWDAHLRGTIEGMKGFPDSEGRFLLIVSRSTSSEHNREYAGGFPKCSVRPSKVYASTPLNAGVDELVAWVVANIPTR